MRAFPTNWCSGCGGGHNFGDQLTPELLTHFGVPFTWAPPAKAKLVCVGSILSKIPSGWRGTVWGTGLIKPGVRRDLRRARVLAVRGERTRRACYLPASTVLGDPGILVGDLLGPHAPPAAPAPAAAPHYVDAELAARHPGATVISITRPPLEVIAAIAGASVLYTSSLHALIAADALGVPHVLELGPTIGGLHKFLDYASAFDETIVPGVERLTNRGAMAERQASLRAQLALVLP